MMTIEALPHFTGTLCAGIKSPTMDTCSHFIVSQLTQKIKKIITIRGEFKAIKGKGKSPGKNLKDYQNRVKKQPQED